MKVFVELYRSCTFNMKTLKLSQKHLSQTLKFFVAESSKFPVNKYHLSSFLYKICILISAHQTKSLLLGFMTLLPSVFSFSLNFLPLILTLYLFSKYLHNLYKLDILIRLSQPMGDRVLAPIFVLCCSCCCFCCCPCVSVPFFVFL